MRAAAAASGTAVRRRTRRPRRRRLEVTSPKSALVRGHLSSGNSAAAGLGVLALRGFCLATPPSSLVHRLRHPEHSKGLSVLSSRGPDRAEPGSTGAVSDHGVPLQEENRGW